MAQTIRKEGTSKSQRRRECWNCGGKIAKGEIYVYRQVRYDKTIMSFFYCNSKECAPHHLVTEIKPI